MVIKLRGDLKIITGSIYIIKNTVNDKVYIGQTIRSVHERFMQHKKPSSSKRNYKFYRAMRKIGPENFYVEILKENIDIKNLDKEEIYYIEKYNSYKNGYNSTPGGDGRVINKVEHEEKILELANNKISSIEIADIFGVSNATIFRILRKHNFKYINKITKEKLEECLYKNMSNKEMAEFFRVDIRTVTRNLKKYGLSKYREKVCLRKDFKYEEFKKDYINGKSREYLSKKYNLSENVVTKLAKKLNIIDLRKDKRNRMIELAKKLRQEGKKVEYIQKYTGLTKYTIYKYTNNIKKCND